MIERQQVQWPVVTEAHDNLLRGRNGDRSIVQLLLEWSGLLHGLPILAELQDPRVRERVVYHLPQDLEAVTHAQRRGLID